MKKNLFLCLLLSAVGVGFAQPNVTRYYADECKVMSKPIYVATNGLSFLEFWDTIDANGIFSPGVSLSAPVTAAATTAPVVAQLPFIADPIEGSNILNISTNLSAGESPLTVWVKGQPCLLNLEIKPNLSGPQRYIIAEERPLPAVSTSGEGGPINTEDLSLNIEGVSTVSDGEAHVYFTFINDSASVVTLDTAKVRFTQDGDSLATEVKKNPLKQLVQPGEAQGGFVLVKGAREGVGQLQWSVLKMGSQEEVVFDETVAIPIR